MGIYSQKFSFNKLITAKASTYMTELILPNEIEGVTTELISVKGPCSIIESARTDIYDVLLILNGNGIIQNADKEFSISEEAIVRIPYGTMYQIHVPEKKELHSIRIRKSLNWKDRNVIRQNPKLHSMMYDRRFSDCPAYSEDIKSAKTVNRMFLPEGYVPRFCMGSVRTQGPDKVDSHNHPMLDQLFLGLKDCHCTCYANGSHALLTENTLLHIPLGSDHSVSVEQGNILSYIWLDFFLTLEGQEYMNQQHIMNED